MKNVVLACGLMFFLLEICLSMPFSINVIFSCELEGAAVTYLCEAFYFSGEYIDQVNEVDQVVDAVLSAVEEQATRLFFLAKLNEFERDLYGPADKLAKQIINKTRNMINAQQSTLTQLRNAAHCLKDLSKLLSLFKDVQMLCEARDVVMAIDVHKAISKILDLNYAVFADNQGTVELNRAVLVS
ncbi:hypothetical protein FJ364_02990, partial [Candidatus Dependentiae bacterium]|nr:hypothetical protein [Candidatus Dependentiae bacterium]